jgi:hypothetical protein
MKKVALLSTVVVAAIALGSSAYAHMWDQGGAGCGMMGYGPGGGKIVDVEKFKQFQKETSTLRDEMMAKKIELHNEYLKDKPDTDRIATLQKDVIDLRTKIGKAADKAGLEGLGHCGGGPMGRGPMGGHGMMGGYGPCGGPCTGGR